MVWVGGCGDGRGAASGPREGVPAGTVPGVGLDPEDEVDAVDLAVAAGGALHVTWREVDRRPDGSGLPSYRAVHAVKEAGAWGRSSPEVLPLRHRPRLVAAGTSLHLVAGPRLEHLRREGDGGWRVLDPLTEPDRPPALAFDLAAAGGEVAAACTSRLPDGSAFALYLLSSEGAPSRQLAQLPSSVFDQPAPRLLIDGKRLDLLWAVNGERRRILTRGGRTTEEITPRAGVFYLRSDDGGATWRPPAEVTAGLPEPPSTVDSVELVRDGRGILALYASFGLYASRSSDGRRWSAPVRIAAGDGSSLAAGSGVYSVTAAGGAIAWIDERHRRSDRRWWNPLGGWPWSDAPAWANNDVFLMQLPAVAAALSGGEARFERLTPDLSYAGQVRLGASRSHRYVLWSGRRRVGKHRTDRGAPPEIFLLRRPLP